MKYAGLTVKFIVSIPVTLALMSVCLAKDKNKEHKKAHSMSKVNTKAQCLWDGDFVFDCKYRNVIMGTKDVEIRVPVFGGVEGEIDINELHEKLGMGEVAFSFAFRYEPTQAKKLLLEILDFYKASLLKDIDIYKPTIIGGEYDRWIIWYDFNADSGIPGKIMISAPSVSANGSDNIDKAYLDPDGELRDIRGINIGEYKRKKNPRVITFSINFGERSPFYKVKK